MKATNFTGSKFVEVVFALILSCMVMGQVALADGFDKPRVVKVAEYRDLSVAQRLVCAQDEDCSTGYCSPSGQCVQCVESPQCPSGGSCDNGLCIFDIQCYPGLSFCAGSNVLACDDSGDYAYLKEMCSDGDACTIGDFCFMGMCAKPVAVNCDTNNPCTDDWCDSAVGCVTMDNFLGCDDGDKCTDGDYCEAGECQPGAWDFATCECFDDADCDHLQSTDLCDPIYLCIENECVIDYSTAVYCEQPETFCLRAECNPATGQCEDHPIESLILDQEVFFCDDGDPCTVKSVCENGTCQPGKDKCNDNNVCSDDFCEPQTGECTHTPNFGTCSDHNNCTVKDFCSATDSGLSFCTGHQIDILTSNDPCTKNVCLPAFGPTTVPIYSAECTQ